MSPTEEKQRLTLAYLEEMTLAHLQERGRAVPIGELLLYLATLSRNDALISRALAGLQTRKRVELGVDRHMRLVPTHAIG